ncbi:hypothetical protein GA0111570_11625 [Raineyella antarctica]|uniref:Uncharacterized protein n=1 Tax=Raineyella antarctica TaxID=1577474 RepID=A0A1G6IH64_9ACTN|nr:hypothetical protein [Raineyella antarctica]SDC05355.1 hypothetical protein GA0111570_11625 [Raineyella antarctica]
MHVRDDSNAEVVERDLETAMPPGNRPRRESRWDKTLQVRLPVEAWEAVVAEAEKRGLPVSTLAGELLIAQLATLDSSTPGVIARIRADLDTLSSRVE